LSKNEFIDHTNLQETIIDAVVMDLAGLKKLENLKTFGTYTEGHKPEGDIYFNAENIVFTKKEDYDYCRYYNKNGRVMAIALYHADLKVYVLSIYNCPILKSACGLTS